MLPFQAEPSERCQRSPGGFFRITALCRGLRKICRSKAWGSVNEGEHFVCVTEFAGSHNAAMANFFRITSHNRGLRKIVQDKAQGSGREGAYFVYATERTGSCNAVLVNFSAVRPIP